MTWDGKRFNYHGECDLVLVHSESFQGGKGLDVHVRTKIESIYSLITAVAIKVGDSIFEFNHETVGEPKYFVDKTEISEIPYQDADFTVTTRFVHNKDHNKMVQIIKIDLGGRSYFQIDVMDQWVFVGVISSSKDIRDSVGLSGSYPGGEMLGRDGSTELSHDRNAYGSQWQVQQDEPQLFHSTSKGHPPAPHATCKLPTEDGHQYLRTKNSDIYCMAVEACQKEGISPQDMDDCIFDVSVLSNPKIAAAW